jgi:hypothetical protein
MWKAKMNIGKSFHKIDFHSLRLHLKAIYISVIFSFLEQENMKNFFSSFDIDFLVEQSRAFDGGRGGEVEKY